MGALPKITMNTKIKFKMIYTPMFIGRFFLCIAFALSAFPLVSQESEGNLKALELSYLFEAGTEGYACFRIPAIVTTNEGTLLAFAEGRKNGCSDTGSIDLVMKRSTDGGRSWSGLQVVWQDGENTCGNPAPVVDRTTGDIFLLSTWNLGQDHESEIIAQTSKDTRRVFLLKSTDEGLHWSKPKEITADVKLPSWTWYATGPGSGIQLLGGAYKGRLVIACDHIEEVTKKYYSHIIYSDDHGESWRLGGSTPKDQVNECEVVELSDHTLMLNMRNYDRSKSSRQLAFSLDGGESWQNMHHHQTLIEPICQASTLRVDYQGQPAILFLNPADKKERRNMTLRLSRDNGKSWPVKKQIFPGPSAYSDLTLVDKENIGILYEGGLQSAYQGIIWESVRLGELIGL